MQESYVFEIPFAIAECNNNGGVTYKLYYPKKKHVFDGRLPEDPEWGVRVLEKLRQYGYTEIATAEHPIRPPGAGSVYMFDDDVLLVHRRDPEAPTHQLYHSIPAGFPNTCEHVYTKEGLMDTVDRETAEENLLITRDREPWLRVPADSRHHTLTSAKNLGLDLREMGIEYFSIERLPGPDVLEVYEDSFVDRPIFTAHGFVNVLWEPETGINFVQIKRVKDVKSTDILPVDAEGMPIAKGWKHFNRESYLFKLKDLAGLPSGTPLDLPEVYKTKWEETGNGRIPRPVINREGYPVPGKFGLWFGPDKTEVTYPHIFSPGSLLTRVLDGLDVQGYDWIAIQREREERRLREKKK